MGMRDRPPEMEAPAPTANRETGARVLQARVHRTTAENYPELAHILAHVQHGSYRAPCPRCDRGPRDTSMGITRDDRGVVFHCFRCGWSGSDRAESEASRYVVPRHTTPRDPTPALAFFQASKSITPSDTAGQYLLARGCVIPPDGTHLRWHPSARHLAGHVGPALVAAVTDAVTGEFLSTHRTWIDPNRIGKKADVTPPRCFWRGLPVRGGVVRLWPDDHVHGGLGIGEGIETCLAMAHAYTPVWSCLDAGHVAAFPVLNGIESLVIAMDNDPAGTKATKACATRWTEAGAEVLIVASEHDGHDVADEAAS